MNFSFQLILDGSMSAKDNMLKDKELLKNIHPCSVILRFYKWQNFCVTYGLSKRAKQSLDLSLCSDDNVETCVRPTGGGIVFHGDDIDFTYTLIVGKDVKNKFLSDDLNLNYHAIHKVIVKALKQNNIDADLCREAKDNSMPESCFLRFAENDILYQNKKIAGAAQRITKEGFLHQGYLSLNYKGCSKYLKDTSEVDFAKCTYPLKNILSSVDHLEILQENIIQEIKLFFCA